MSNNLRTRNGMPFNFVNGLKVRGMDIESLIPGIEGIPEAGSKYQFAGNGSNKVFTLPVSPYNKDAVDVYVKQLYVHPDDYTLVGDVVTLTEAPPALDAGETYNVVIKVSLTTLNGYVNANRVSFEGENLDDILEKGKPLTNYSNLRAYAGAATQVRITDPGIAGFFYYDASDTTSVDNGGTVIVASNGKRWKRVFDGVVNILWFLADPNGQSGSADALLSAWTNTPIGSTLLVPPGSFKIEKATVLTHKGCNIQCHGEFVVSDGTWVGITFTRDPDFTLSGNDLSSITADDLSLIPIVSTIQKTEKYYVSLRSTEILVNRVGTASYAPYEKWETHDFASDGYMLKDPILYSYLEPSKLSVRIISKTRPAVFNGLRVVAADTASPSNRTLVSFVYASNLTLNDFQLIHPKSAIGVGLQLAFCCHITFNRPIIDGYNNTLGDSYKILNSGSAHVSFDGYMTQTPDDPNGSKLSRDYNARHGNMVSFRNCHLIAADDHFGSNYTFTDCTLVNPVAWAGKNITFRNITCHNGLVGVRTDTPYASGKLTAKDIRVPTGKGNLIYFTTGLESDPLGRTTPLKFFDDVEIDGVYISGTQTSYDLISLQGNRNPATYISEASKRFIARNIVVDANFADGQTFCSLGNVSYPYIEFDGIQFNRPRTDAFGEFRSYGNNITIGEIVIKNSRNISMYYLPNIQKLTLDDCTVTTRCGIAVNVDYTNVEIFLKAVRFSGKGIIVQGTGATYKALLYSDGCSYGAATTVTSTNTILVRSSNNIRPVGGSARPAIFPTSDSLRYYVNPTYLEG